MSDNLLQWVNQSLFRRVKVENELWACFSGKRDLPTREECKEWALILGVPDDIRKEVQAREKSVNEEASCSSC